MRIFRNQDHETLLDYAGLLSLLLIGLFLVRLFDLHRNSILVASIPLSLGYVLWGVLHHKKHGHIDRKILFEYLGLAILVNAIILVLVT